MLVGERKPAKASLKGPGPHGRGQYTVTFDFNPEKINAQLGATTINISGGGVTPQDANTSTSTGGSPPIVQNSSTAPGGQAPKTPKFQFKGYLVASGAADMVSSKVMHDALTLQLWCSASPSAPPGGGNAGGSNRPHPPPTVDKKIVTFDWGEAFKQIKGQITAVTVEFLTFDDQGWPLIASIDVTLQTESDYKPPQNPTSGGLAPIGAHEVIAGDSLPSVAFGAYGQARYWRHIARENGIDDPMRVAPGTMLRLPVLTELTRNNAD